jgi:hypothetical protein
LHAAHAAAVATVGNEGTVMNLGSCYNLQLRMQSVAVVLMKNQSAASKMHGEQHE